jgi:hypothetical protein
MLSAHEFRLEADYSFAVYMSNYSTHLPLIVDDYANIHVTDLSVLRGRVCLGLYV